MRLCHRPRGVPRARGRRRGLTWGDDWLMTTDARHPEPLLETGALQRAIFQQRSDLLEHRDRRQGRHPDLNVGAERMLGYTAAEVMNKITPADISDPQERDRARRRA